MLNFKSKKFKKTLVVEGGGMRGIFAAGVLDSFLEKGFDPFDSYVGVSAGACNLSSHLAGQIFRNYRTFMYQMATSRFINLKQFARGGHLMDLDWLWSRLDEMDPLDVPAAYKFLKAGRKQFFAVATNIATGTPDYIAPNISNWNTVLKATSAVPLLYRKTPEVGGEKYTDGGMSDPIPVRFTINKGARKIMVIRSRPADYTKSESSLESKFMQRAFRNDFNLQKVIHHQPIVYQDSVDLINKPPPKVEIVQIAPPGSLQCSRTTRNRNKLQADYDLGRRLGFEMVEKGF